MRLIDLDKRICDIEPNATNTETYREFIINSIHHFYGENAAIPKLDKMSESEINDIVDELDYLWGK